MHSIGIRNVFDIYKTINIPIIGVGGITTSSDIVEYLLAGATAVQIGSGVYYRGVDIFNKINDELAIWMKEHSYSSIKQLIGAAHQ